MKIPPATRESASRRFPNELIKNVVQHTTEASTLAAMMQVSHGMYDLAAPLLYDVLVINKNTLSTDFVAPLADHGESMELGYQKGESLLFQINGAKVLTTWQVQMTPSNKFRVSPNHDFSVWSDTWMYIISRTWPFVSNSESSPILVCHN
jgi:hypothetical protein